MEPTDQMTDEELADYAQHVADVPDGRGDESEAPDHDQEVPA